MHAQYTRYMQRLASNLHCFITKYMLIYKQTFTNRLKKKTLENYLLLHIEVPEINKHHLCLKNHKLASGLYNMHIISYIVHIKVSMEDARRSVGRMWEARGF